MIWGLSLSSFTTLHVAISLIAILSGFVVVYGMLTAKSLPQWTAIFLATTTLTSASGFLFPSDGLLPSHIVGIISLAFLAVALVALYARRARGAWRWIYVTTALMALYLNVFVAVVQSFQKISFLRSFAPTQSEAPFIVAQVGVMAAFAWLGFLAVRRYHPEDAPVVAGPRAPLKIS